MRGLVSGSFSRVSLKVGTGGGRLEIGVDGKGRVGRASVFPGVLAGLGRGWSLGVDGEGKGGVGGMLGSVWCMSVFGCSSACRVCAAGRRLVIGGGGKGEGRDWGVLGLV